MVSLYAYIPTFEEILYMADGSGCNLDADDCEQGYVDYVYYEQHALEQEFPETDGGLLMLKEVPDWTMDTLKSFIPKVLELAYGNDTYNYIVLNDVPEEKEENHEYV